MAKKRKICKKKKKGFFLNPFVTTLIKRQIFKANICIKMETNWIRLGDNEFASIEKQRNKEKKRNNPLNC